MKRIGLLAHCIADYFIGILLILIPLFPGFSTESAETWAPVGVGVVMLLYSLLTDYRGGIFKLLPMQAHLLMDMAAGIFLAVSPWLFGFAAVVWEPHVLTGFILFLVATITRRRTALRSASARRKKLHKPTLKTFFIR